MERLRSWTVCRACSSVFLASASCGRCAGVPDPLQSHIDAPSPPNLRPPISLYAVGFGLGVVAALVLFIAV